MATNNAPLLQDFENPQATAPKAEPIVREIDIGGRIQRFEAATEKELIDKLLEAQTHATRKLQELSVSMRARGPREPERESSDWQELKPSLLKAEDIVMYEKNPVELFRQMYKAEFGITPEEGRVRENERRRQEAEFRAGREFIERHREFSNTPENAARLTRFLQEQNLPISKNNLDYAYDQLREELIPLKASSHPIAEPKEPARPQPEVSPPPSFVRPSLGGRAQEQPSGGFDAAEAARIAQLPPREMKASIERWFRESRNR